MLDNMERQVRPERNTQEQKMAAHWLPMTKCQIRIATESEGKQAVHHTWKGEDLKSSKRSSKSDTGGKKGLRGLVGCEVCSLNSLFLSCQVSIAHKCCCVRGLFFTRRGASMHTWVGVVTKTDSTWAYKHLSVRGERTAQKPVCQFYDVRRCPWSFQYITSFNPGSGFMRTHYHPHFT